MSDIKFIDNSDEVLKALDRGMQNALTAIGLTAEGHAKKNAPVDTGRLRNSITHAKDKDSAYIGSNVKYAPYVEFGAQGRKPNHFLKRAITENTAEYKKLAEEALKNT